MAALTNPEGHTTIGSSNGAAVAAWPATTELAPAIDRVRVFDAEPDLLEGVDPRTADLLRRRGTARRLWVEPGGWTPDPPAADGHLGLLVIDGLMTRSIELDGRSCPELVGPGELIRPWDAIESSVEHDASWRALTPTTLAVLDEAFTAIVCRWPSIVVALMTRATQRTRSVAFTLAIAHMRRAEPRLYACLWHLADRWGRVTPEGVHIPLRLTHELLAHLTCMRRPTASTCLRRMCDTGRIARRRDGTWLLLGGPPAPGVL